jgi:methylated-DNA-[protein]-cysteine S-methyltransferase
MTVPNGNRRNGDDRLEAALSARETTDRASWRRVHAGLAERAATEGLVDVAFELHDSPLGQLLVGATEEGLVKVGLPAENHDQVLDDLARRISPRVLMAPRDAVARARHELDEYFQGRRRAFALPLDWRLTRGFRREVLRATAAIPYGRTSSYREVAAEAGSPAAVRAAGTALATNPLPIVVPCHRVLRSGGQIGSYGGGPEMKAWLLELERGGSRD